MTAYTIDTLATARKLEQAGFKTEQAEAVAKAIAHSGQELATKEDIAGIRRDVVWLRWICGIILAFVLGGYGLLFAIWRDVASLGAG